MIFSCPRIMEGCCHETFMVTSVGFVYFIPVREASGFLCLANLCGLELQKVRKIQKTAIFWIFLTFWSSGPHKFVKQRSPEASLLGMKYPNPADVTMKFSWQHPSIMRRQEKIIGFSMCFYTHMPLGRVHFGFVGDWSLFDLSRQKATLAL